MKLFPREYQGSIELVFIVYSDKSTKNSNASSAIEWAFICAQTCYEITCVNKNTYRSNVGPSLECS